MTDLDTAIGTLVTASAKQARQIAAMQAETTHLANALAEKDQQISEQQKQIDALKAEVAHIRKQVPPIINSFTAILKSVYRQQAATGKPAKRRVEPALRATR